jgi:putative hydrolase of the HAD superfamily
MAERLILWDFDGTLGWRPGLWSGCVLEVLDEHEPGHGLAAETVRAGMRGHFPWHLPERQHTHLSDGESWWAPVQTRIAEILTDGGIAAARAGDLAAAVRRRFVDPAIGWRLFDDTLPALQRAREAGWRNAVLSNHVPELPQIADALGLSSALDALFTSAAIGYEKPNPEAFGIALSALGQPEEVWMIGDSARADVAGAEALGIPAVLVRSEGQALRRADGLHGALDLVIAH